MYGMDRASMDSIKGLLEYISRTHQDMNPYMKRLNTTLDSWRLHSDWEGWKLQGYELNTEELEGKWDGVEEIDKPRLVK